MQLSGFEVAHEAFLRYMQANAPGGEVFVGFDHPFIQSDEIEYKRLVVAKAHEALQLSRWKAWAKQPGLILGSVRNACSPDVSANLLEHRFGTSGSYKALYRVTSDTEIEQLEAHLSDMFLGGSRSRSAFAPRFDEFASYLRTAKLGSNWAFVAYLAFLADHRRYFPILPTQFERLSQFYGLDGQIVGLVEWKRYALLLDLAEELASRLREYGPVDLISVQSYMWVVSGLIRDEQVGDASAVEAFDYQGELGRRQRSAAEQERIGLKGERYVEGEERERLRDAGLMDLAAKVRLVSIDPSLGYDVLSFQLEGKEMHIEVKTTTRSKASDIGFFLSDYEKGIADADPNWRIYRVWEIDVDPEIGDLGNLVRHPTEDWVLEPSSWKVKPSWASSRDN